MKIKSCLNLIMTAATVLFINTNSFPAGGMENEDIAIIGSGSGAFSAAIHLANKGIKVTMIEEKTVGGTCVNVGCVPSKIFIRAGQIAHMQQNHPFKGIQKNSPTVNSTFLLEQQQQRVLELREAKYENILTQNPNVKFIQGTACLTGTNKVLIKPSDDNPFEISPTKILIATGSSPTIPNIEGLQNTPYWTSTEALLSGVLPNHLIVLGGSVVAVELAQAFSHLGSKVTMLARSTLLSKEDPNIGTELKKVFEGEGIRVLTHTLPQSVGYKEGTFQINFGDQTIFGDHLLVATGRYANTRRLGLEELGLKVDFEGKILVDDHLRTNVKNIFAAGDCTQLPQYVYVAAASGSKAAINMLSEYTGEDSSLDLSIVPAVIFTEPQVATVGLSARQAEVLGYEIETRTLTLDNVPRALANFDTRGFFKLVADKRTKRILGSQIVASEAGDVIQSVALAIRGNMTTHELASQLFPYLTMVEGLKLCAQIFFMDVKKLSCCAYMEESSVSLSNTRNEKTEKKSLVTDASATSECFFESVCDRACQTMINYIPSLPTLIARLFISQCPALSEQGQDVSLQLFRLLTVGKPVDVNSLAESVSLPLLVVDGIIKKWSDVYYDELNRVVGYGGLTFKPTEHKIRFDDYTLYTWCAWDTLFLPTILGKTLDIESHCPMDNSIVRIRVDQEGVKAIEPKETVISFMLPSQECIQRDIQRNFCQYVNFFPSAEVGNQWIESHPKTYLISIEEAFKIGQMKNQAQFGKRLQDRNK